MPTKSLIENSADSEVGSLETSLGPGSSTSGDDTNALLDGVDEDAEDPKDECMDLEEGSIVFDEAPSTDLEEGSIVFDEAPSTDLEEASFDPQYLSRCNRLEIVDNDADDDAKEMEKVNYDERMYEGAGCHEEYKAKNSSFFLQERREKAKNKNVENTDAEEGDKYNLHTYPPDCYSFISLHGPTLIDLKSVFSPNGPSDNLRLFGLGLLVFVFQCALAAAMWFSVLDPKWGTREEDNPGKSTLANIIAANASPVLQATQFIAILSYVVFAEASLLDITTAIETFPMYPMCERKDTSGDQEFLKIEESDRGKLWCQCLSCILRFVQGFLVMTAAFFLVITSNTAVEVVLNFAAVNFISEMDNVGFQMALDGRYGKRIRENAKRIPDVPLPHYMSRKNNRSRFKWISRILGITLLGFMTTIYMVQNNKNIWRTKVVRVAFADRNIKRYSGCYYQDQRDNIIVEAFKRDTHHTDDTKVDKARFGYCGDNRRWMLFKDDDEDGALDVCNLTENTKLAYSEKTESFDLATGLAGGWYTAFGAPLNFYVMELQKNDEGDCSLVGDGKCNPSLNRLEYNYDGGDCCSATCSHVSCGTISTMEAFNVSNGVVEPNLVLECDEKVVLSLHASEDMMNGSQTVFVNDGADCTMSIVNQVSPGSTTWFVDYSVFIEDEVNDKMKIIHENSEITGSVNFTVIPKCMLEILSEKVDILKMYTNHHAKKAMNWIAKDKGNSNCQDQYFTERFALSVLNFAAPVQSTPWFNSNPTCLWFTAECTEEVPSTLSFIYMEMKGALTSYIQLLQSFSTIHMYGNDLTGTIPTEIGALTGLTDLSLYDNSFSGTIPTEIGELTELMYLSLSYNNLTGTIPSEIGKLTELIDLSLSFNNLSGTIPSEIGKLTGLTELSLSDNDLGGTIQTEFGSLVRLTSLSLLANKLKGPIPNELKSLTELTYIDLANNELSGTIPPFLKEIKAHWFGKGQFKGLDPQTHPKTPNHLFWDNNWPSDLMPTNQNDALLEGTVLFAQAQTIPSKHGVKNDKQPHLAALRKTLVMLKMHREEWVSIELVVRDKDGAVVSGHKPIAMNDPENLPKHVGWMDLGGDSDYVSEFPLALDNPYVVKGQDNLNMIGKDPTGAALKDILNDSTKTPTSEVQIETADGSWVGTIYLPDGSAVPAGSKVQIICGSSWGVSVYYPNLQTGGWRSKNMKEGDVLNIMLTDYNRNVWMAPDDPLPDYVPEFPLALDNPYVVRGQDNLDMIEKDPTGAALKNILNNSTNTPTSEVQIETADGSWVRTIYLPDGSAVPAGSKVQIICGSSYEVSVYYPNLRTGGWRSQNMKKGDVHIFVLSRYNNAWVVPGDLNHNEYAFARNFYSATLKPEWVKPGMTLEFAASNGPRGVLEAKVGGITELIITTLNGAFLTERQSGFHFRDDPAANQEYFETVMATRLIAVQYETIHLTEIMLPTGIFYNNFSSDEGRSNEGDMIEHGRILLSHGINLANYGISSSLAQSESNYPFTCALLSAHNIWALYQNEEINHGWYWTNRNGILTLWRDGSIGHQFSKMVGNNLGLSDSNAGGFDGQVHRPANEINSAWVWDSKNNLFIPNFHYSNTGESQCHYNQCQSPFIDKFKYNSGVVTGEDPQFGSNRYPLYTPHEQKKIQEFLESKAIWDVSSSTGFRKYDASSGEMIEFVNEANGNKAPRLHRVPVTTIVGYYEPDSGRGLQSYVYPALHGALGFVYDDDGASGAGGCELVVKTNKGGTLVFNLDTSVDPKGMNKFHVNVATADESTEASLYCQSELLAMRALDGPREDRSPLTYTVNGYSEYGNDAKI